MSEYPAVPLAPSATHEIATEPQSANSPLSRSPSTHNPVCHFNHHGQYDVTNGNNYNTGRWSNKEKKLFKQGVKIYGKKWNLLQTFIKTRTPTQIRSHAQKLAAKLGKFNISHYCSNVMDENSNDSATKSDTKKDYKPDEIRDKSRKMLEITYCTLANQIKCLTSGISHSISMRNIHFYVDSILNSHTKLIEQAMDNKPLSPIELKNIAAVKKDIDTIVVWYRNIREVHLQYRPLKYLYEAVLSDVIDLPNFSFLGLIRKSTNKGSTNSPYGFTPFEK